MPQNPLLPPETARQLAASATRFAEVQKAMQGTFSHVVRQYQEVMRAFDATSAIREAVTAINLSRAVGNEVMTSAAALRRAYESIATSGLWRDVAETASVVRALQQSSALHDIAKQLNAGREAFEQLARGPLFEAAQTFAGMQKELRQALASNGITAIHQELLRSFETVQWPAFDDPAVRVQLRPDGTLVAGDAFVSVKEIQTVVAEVLERTGAKTDQTIEEQVNRLIEETRKLKHPLIQQFVFYVLIPIIAVLLAALINPIADQQVRQLISTDKRALKKAINNGVAEKIDCGSLGAFRLVTATTLHVRAKPSSTAPVIGTMRFGQAVQLLERERSWAKIKWTSEDGEAFVEGWVFARYLEKFK